MLTHAHYHWLGQYPMIRGLLVFATAEFPYMTVKARLRRASGLQRWRAVLGRHSASGNGTAAPSDRIPAPTAAVL